MMTNFDVEIVFEFLDSFWKENIMKSKLLTNLKRLSILKYFKTFNCYKNLQGDPNQNPLFQMAVLLKQCISDPMSVKPKCVGEAVDLFGKIVKKTAAKCKQIFKN